MQQENQADGLSELEQSSKERSECFGVLQDTYRNTNIIFAFLYNCASVTTSVVYRPQVRACQNTILSVENLYVSSTEIQNANKMEGGGRSCLFYRVLLS